LFSGVTIPHQGGLGQAQIITTKTLVIYGSGRNGSMADSLARLYAVDKATGKQVGAISIPSRTTAVPMTFLHNGRQYIVFAIGGGEDNKLVSVALPRGRKTTN